MHKLRSLVAVLALGIPTLAAAQPVAKKRPDPTSTFLQQDKYTYCDVKILASLWKQSISDAKATVGMKLQAKSDRVIDGALVDARKHAAKKGSARCTFAEAGFTYQDAQALAKIWKQTEGDAKLMAEAKILGGAEKYVRELVGKSSSSEDPTSTYLKQDKYTYCDVKLLAGLWKSSISDAKATVGAKLQSKNETYLESELAKARTKPRQRCSWAEAGLAYSDIEKLAKLWKISITKAKATASRKATTYGGAYVRELIADTSSEAEADLSAFLQQDKYTYCDAAMIASMWKQSVEEGKAFIGMKLNAKNPAAIDRTLVDARAAARTKPVAGCGQYKMKK